MPIERDVISPAGTLAELAASVGEPHRAQANQPKILDEPQAAWFVEKGAIDVFVVKYARGRFQSAFKHLLRLESGRIAFGAPASDSGHSLRLVAKGLPESVLRRIEISTLVEKAERAEGPTTAALVTQVDAWIEDFASAVAREVAPRPRVECRLVPGLPVEACGIASSEHGVAWLAGGKVDAAFLEVAEPEPGAPGLVPVTRDSWLALNNADGISCRSSRDLDLASLLARALPEFHRLALRAEAIHRQLMLADEANYQVQRSQHRRRQEADAEESLLALLGGRRSGTDAGSDSLSTALQAVGKYEGIPIRTPSLPHGSEPGPAELLETSRIRGRRVRLVSEDRWWLGDSGAMLAFRNDDERPVALLPGRSGRYRILDPATGRSRPANARTAAELKDHAWLLYRSLPTAGAVGRGDLFKVASHRTTADLVRLVAAGLGAGLLALSPAVAVNVLAGSLIPAGNGDALARVAAMLVGLAFAAGLFHTLRGTALMRLEGRIAARLSAALWDRMLRLRPSFFRRYSAGDLAVRANAFQDLRDRVCGLAADAFLSTLFLLPAFGLLFFLSPALGWLTLGIGVLALAVASVLTVLHVRPQRSHLESARRLAADLLQFLNGIGKIRAAAAEGSAFALWVRHYKEHKQAEIRLSFLSEHLAAFGAAVPALAGAVLFAGALRQPSGELDVAGFLAVYTAAMVFYVSLVNLTNTLPTVASAMPTVEQVRPIIEESTHEAVHRLAPVTLQGELRLERVSFGYSEDGPMVLRDVSIRARPGEFVAIVGESGAGKSTILRLALGLEAPSSGAVYYDGQELSRLDGDSVRRQVGVVMQDSALQSGNVLNNIIGVMDDLTIDDAWRAARLAAVDRDIAAMPMGMFTPVGENASTFSGGQNQRIRIAAAMVRNPVIVFLDEPTSWLDAKGQEETMQGIEGAAITRIVIAHRLSTIRNADRIYVLGAGTVTQVGRYEELLEAQGPFREFVLHQLA